MQRFGSKRFGAIIVGALILSVASAAGGPSSARGSATYPFRILGDDKGSTSSSGPERWRPWLPYYFYRGGFNIEYGDGAGDAGPQLPSHTVITVVLPKQLRIDRYEVGTPVGAGRGTIRRHKWVWRAPSTYHENYVGLQFAVFSHFGMRRPFRHTKDCFTVTVTGDGVAPQQRRGCVIGHPHGY